MEKGPRCAVPSVGRRGEQDLARVCAACPGSHSLSLSVCSFYLLRPSALSSPHNPDPFVLTFSSHHHHSDQSKLPTSPSSAPPGPVPPCCTTTPPFTHALNTRTGPSIPLPPSQQATTILSRPSPAHTGGPVASYLPPPKQAGHPSRAGPSQSITTPHILRPRH